MSNKDFSIEYAHIYTNDQIADEHRLSLEILGEIRKEKDLINHTSSLVVMIDDYSFPDPSFDYESFALWLESAGHSPDLILRESQLIPSCDKVVNLIEDDDLKKEISNYIRDKKYPCSLFIATWYLLRLGYLHSDIFPENLVANRLINILPESFKPFEEKAIEIIGLTKFADAPNQIEYRYLEGRGI